MLAWEMEQLIDFIVLLGVTVDGVSSIIYNESEREIMAHAITGDIDEHYISI